MIIDWDWTFPGWLRIGLALACSSSPRRSPGGASLWLVKLIRSGKKAEGRTDDLQERFKDQVVEVFGQKRLLKWNAPGIAHFFTFWGFVILGLTIVEAFGALVLSQDFAFPIFGHAARGSASSRTSSPSPCWPALIYFAINRLRNAPERKQRASRFYGSHTGPAWAVLGMIALVVITLLLYRGAQYNTGHFPFGQSKCAVRVLRSSPRRSGTARTTRASRRSSCSRRWPSSSASRSW